MSLEEDLKNLADATLPDWGDITFMAEHDKEIGKIAVVGEEGWRDMICAFLAKGFRGAQIEYFLPGDLAKARTWLEGGTR